MAPDIRPLDQSTVDRIAAGEVVERPASVVKELVENSIDAGASRVDVTVEAGGTDRVVVSDDGHGMSESDARLAVQEHTTSKIGDIDDLESGVGTLGFRGEALHAIAAVSTLTLRTREQGADRGTELRVEGGEVVDVSTVGCPEGTTVEVADLFHNVPARRKYLKADSTEFSHVNSVVSGYALANPEVAVSLTHGGRETFATEGRGDRRSAVMSVYGREVAANMVPVEGTDEEGPLDGVSGLVSHPETNRATREYVNVFVNGRWVTATAVRDAVVEAYGRQLASDRYPFAVLDVEVDPATVDVNVHPRKLEVRFADEDGMARQVRDAVESALLAEGLIRTSAPRGRSKAEQTEIAPERSGGSDGDASDEDVSDEDVSDGTDRPPGASADGRATGNRAGNSADEGTDGRSGPSTDAGSNRGDDGPGDVGRAAWSPDGDETPGSTRNGGVDADRKFRETPTQTTFDGSDPAEQSFETLPAMRVLGQLHDTYVVAETDEGLVLVDQHAADERVNYERLRERFDDDVTTQALAEPVELSLTAKEAALAEPASDALARLGFHATLVDDRTLRVTTVPALLADAAGPELVRDLLGDFADGDPDRTVEAAADDLLGDLACYPSITGNESLTEGTVTDLLSALDDCENPYACPHGRPVVVELGHTELEERFERDYPGHGG
ncbi:DNA mismatch repair endonuclease MutL [Halorarius halobius]|uniref:DNA mismatch repair endonuclease MutL n=1 Tax=Halorarius halobius TaxID=2962671 RepID=UPI0020CEC105|nr:DNA mismatch repair endonuclease MutL [Halorarius halobius]